MTDGVFPDRLTQLRARWDADPSSRIFLQLAEEYRHLGRIQDALMVLDRGLKEHPGYLSALVAKGRCHLELGEGDAARVVLERVVKQDATQMVANKLLVRAFLETGDPVKARERLDLYSLLNDSDPEIEDLRRRIRQLERPTQPERPAPDADPFALEPPAAPAAPAPAARPQAAPAPAGLDIFDLAPPAPPGRGGDDIFDFAPARSAPPAPAVQAVPSAAADDLFALEPLPAPASPASGIPGAPVPPEEEETLVLDEALFPGLASRDSRRRYLDALGSEGLFAFEAPPPPAPAAMAEIAAPPPLEATEATEEASWLDEATAATPAGLPPPLPESLMPAIFAPEPPPSRHEPEATTVEELWSEEPEPLPHVEPEPEVEPEVEPEPELETVVEYELEPEEEAPAEEAEAAVVATATLGELYFRQGHYTEAERIFREVLEREPGNVSAIAALHRLAALGPQPETPRLDARRLLTGYRPDPAQPADAEVRSRKIFLLNRYLDRLRQGSAPDVS